MQHNTRCNARPFFCFLNDPSGSWHFLLAMKWDPCAKTRSSMSIMFIDSNAYTDSRHETQYKLEVIKHLKHLPITMLLLANGTESWQMIQNPETNLYHHQNLATSSLPWSMSNPSTKSLQNQFTFFSNSADKNWLTKNHNLLHCFISAEIINYQLMTVILFHVSYQQGKINTATE